MQFDPATSEPLFGATPARPHCHSLKAGHSQPYASVLLFGTPPNQRLPPFSSSVLELLPTYPWVASSFPTSLLPSESWPPTSCLRKTRFTEREREGPGASSLDPEIQILTHLWVTAPFPYEHGPCPKWTPPTPKHGYYLLPWPPPLLAIKC